MKKRIYCIIGLVALIEMSYSQIVVTKNPLFRYKNFTDTIVLTDNFMENWHLYPRLTIDVLEDKNLLQIDCGTLVNEELKNFFCEQDMISLWERYLDTNYYFKKNTIFKDKAEFIATRKNEIRVYFIGTVWNERKDSRFLSKNYLFMINEDTTFLVNEDYNVKFWNRKLVLLNMLNNQLRSMIIVGHYDYHFRYVSYYNQKSNIYTFKGEYMDDDTGFARKRDERRNRRNNTDLGVVFTFDENGYIKILKEDTKCWQGY